MGAINQLGLTPDMLEVYEKLPGMFLILSPELKMVTASDTYLATTNKTRAEITGKFIFDVFPIDPVAGIADSLNQVINTGAAHQIPIVRCDTPHSDNPNVTVERYWKTSHTPILNEQNKINYIIHFTQEVTELIERKKDIAHNENVLVSLNTDLAQANEEIQASNEELISINGELSHAQHALQKLNVQLEQRVVLRTEQLQLAQKETERERDNLTRFFMQAPAGICVLGGADFVFELVNPPYQDLFPGRALVGSPFLHALPELSNQNTAEILRQVYQTGKSYEGKRTLMPLIRDESGTIEDRYFNFVYQARLDANGKVDGILVFVFEVTDMVLAEQQLDKNQRHLDFLLNAMPQQVWTATPDGSLNYVNDVVCANFGESAAEIIGHGWQRFIHPDDLRKCLKTWEKALRTGTEYVMEFRLQMRTGNYLWFLGRALPFIEDGKVKIWMGTNTNIDLQKENEHKKDEFISIASHELKTPLTNIKAFNQLMKRTQDLESMNNFLVKSQESITRLEKLINDLLDVTKINAGKMRYTMQDFDFQQMLKECVESQQLISKSHQLILTNAANVDFNGDRFRIEQVVINFLTNAIKYSPAGKQILIDSKIELNNIIVSVQDFGIGIAEQDLTRLFERYYRVDNAAMQFEGLGLGLFISSEILKRHQGSFWIESEVGKGSTFFFRLPLDLSNAIQPKVKHQDFYKDESITITYHPVAHRLDVDWTGYQNYDSVYKGGMIMLEMMIKNNCHKIVNDNRHVLGTWSDAADWAREKWFPMMEEAGLRYFAWVYSNSMFSKLSAQKAIDVTMGAVVTQFFTDIKLAESWIDAK